MTVMTSDDSWEHGDEMTSPYFDVMLSWCDRGVHVVRILFIYLFIVKDRLFILKRLFNINHEGSIDP